AHGSSTAQGPGPAWSEAISVAPPHGRMFRDPPPASVPRVRPADCAESVDAAGVTWWTSRVPNAEARFTDRGAVITGASRGIGFAIAHRLLSEGARVCLTARTPEPLAEAVERLGGRERAIGVAGRADDPEHREAALAAAVAAFGRLDVLVN